MKVAKVIIIHKTICPKTLLSYHPTSVLSSLIKFLDKIVRHKIYEHFDFLNSFSTGHFGFWKDLGTGNAVSKLSEAVVRNFDADI